MEKKVRDSQSFNLSQMPAGSISKVVAVRGGGRIAQRLMEMGVVPGVSVKVIKSAPFGDPIEIRLLGYSLAIRRNEASAIEVEG